MPEISYNSKVLTWREKPAHCIYIFLQRFFKLKVCMEILGISPFIPCRHYFLNPSQRIWIYFVMFYGLLPQDLYLNEIFRISLWVLPSIPQIQSTVGSNM